MSCINVLQGTPTKLFFVAANVGTGAPRTGIVYTEVSVSFKKSTQATFTVKTLAASDFTENGSGVYEILFSATELNTLGSFIYIVNSNFTLAPPAIKQFVGQAFIESAATFTPGSITLSTNVLTGNLIDVQGNAIVGAAVSARTMSAPTILGTNPNIGGVGTDIISARTDSSGFFALEVLQKAIVDITIPRVNYRRTLTVPANSTDMLFTLP